MNAVEDDRNRREVIIAATRDLIAEHGVDGVSHRKVAARAQVPLGSMTYYFSGRDELIFEALSSFANDVADSFDASMAQASSVDEAIDMAVDLINVSVLSTNSDLVVTHELYAMAARDLRYREITHAWMARSRAAFERHFTPEQAMLLDALVEGWTVHRALDTVERPIMTAATIRRVLGI